MYNSDLMYIGEFTNNQNTGPKSAFFFQPDIWMLPNMNVGDTVQTTHTYYYLDPTTRDVTGTYIVLTAQTKLLEYLSSYKVPETGVTYNDVIHFAYWPNVNDNSGEEEYWCERNRSWFRSYLNKTGAVQYATPANFNGYTWGYGTDGICTSATYLEAPENPWFSPYQCPAANSNATYVQNGSFENGLTGWITGWEGTNGPITPNDEGKLTSSLEIREMLRSATTPAVTPLTTSKAVVIEWSPTVPPVGFAPNPLDESGPHQLELLGDANLNSDWVWAYSNSRISVIPGATYVLSGYVWRWSSGEYAEIAFNGGWDQNGNPVSDGPTQSTFQTGATGLNGWVHITVSVTMPADVYNTEVWLARKGKPAGGETDSLFDDVRLQLVSLPSNYTYPGW
jgi:hypothetical protein